MPDASHAPVQQPLDAPLPAELTGSWHGWLTGYRVYPVFSAPWARGRQRVFAAWAGLGLTLVVLPLIGLPPGEAPLGGIAQWAVQLFVPLLIGPWLGVAVRRRGWTEVREWIGLLAMVTVLVAGMLAFHGYGAEPMKQWIAQRAGQVDASGQRKRVVMSFGIVVGTPDDAASAPLGSPPDPNPVHLLLGGISALLTFWLGGGFALQGWRRERRSLAALAQARALARAQAERREAEFRLSVLAAQVEPHFLFNTLAGVRSAIATDPARASAMIDRLVDYLRAAIPRLRSDGGAQTTLGGQLEIVRAYLGLMAARMPRLRYSIDAPAELLARPCPPLMLISLAENAVRHGVEPKIGPAHIAVQARREAGGELAITVADDGAGFGASVTGSGLGLTNLRERLQQIYQGRASFVLKARPEGGVSATITLPAE